VQLYINGEISTCATCWAGTSYSNFFGGRGSCGWVLRRIARLMPLVVGEFPAGMCVALPFSSLYSSHVIPPGKVLPWCLYVGQAYGMRVRSPLGISFGCAVRLLGTIAADLRVRVHLTSDTW
jgi:hypothetical protein